MNIPEVLTMKLNCDSATPKGESGIPFTVTVDIADCSEEELVGLVKRALGIKIQNIMRENAKLIHEKDTPEYRQALVDMIKAFPKAINYVNWMDENKVVGNGKGGRKLSEAEKLLRKKLRENGVDPDDESVIAKLAPKIDELLASLDL